MEKKYDDTFLARWLANELTENELKDFESSEDYNAYKQIIETLEEVETPAYNVEENFTKTLQKIQNEKKKSKKVIPLWLLSTAASIALLITVYFGFFANNEVVYYAEAKEQVEFALPDNSEVVLNSTSKITYKKDFIKNRTLNLDGEAFFKVQKGSKFTVESDNGEVSVLGTKFKVNTRNNIYHVTCFEGKVLVVTKTKDSVYLTKNQSFRIVNDKQESFEVSNTEPTWINNESRFSNMPILLVVEELERQFNIQVKGKQNLPKELYSGSFSHSNANIAIASIFKAMDIKYTLEANGNVTVKTN